MKILKTTLWVLGAVFLLEACSDNDDKDKIIVPGPPVGVEVKYEVTASTDMITQISYKMGDGDLFYGTPGPDGSHTTWNKTLVALFSQMPETAYLQTKCINDTETDQTCTLNIYRNNVLVHTQSGVVTPADDDPETDDTVTITTTKIISE
ncbi:hypothetical protein [Flavobacterium caeni]|uniref:Uncharacterized protein n=1 Tax=Flavobacterium caeni TaxID=490189 RepID=A0A1G5F631_9FLAO|nr:hypothetical protein [Flavobacterium caeni]SCY34682.1 hypothetical protein SAMN02927903_01184 [Flavobacterium caeni]